MQKGFALITSVMFLIVLTILVVFAIRSATMHERSAGNIRQRTLAMQAAELTITRAQRILAEYPEGWTADCSRGLCNQTSGNTSDYLVNSSKWIDASSCRIDDAACNVYQGSNSSKTISLDGVAAQPRYIIKTLGTKGSCEYYEITARGVGSNANSAVVLRTVAKAC